jgi:lipoate-protein ligase B
MADMSQPQSGTGAPEHPELQAWWLGRVDYERAHALQIKIRDQIIAGHAPPTLLLLEHDPVVTYGRRGESGDLKHSLAQLEAAGIAVRETERGGRATYHGPGQLVGYPIVRVRAVAANMPSYVCALEEAIIQTLAALGITAERHAGQPGVWVGEEKIAAVGVAVTHGVAWHGFSINVGSDLSGFDAIRPCGLDIPVTSVARQIAHDAPRGIRVPTVRELAEVVAVHIGDALGLHTRYTREVGAESLVTA